MLKVHLYGQFRKLASNPNPDANSILFIEENDNETLGDLILRIGIKLEDLGELFINGNVASLGDTIPPNSRLGIFPLGMHLLCGGQHLKGHGYITKKPQIEQNYWQRKQE
ncbi:MAG: hypothetical protein ACFFGZ_13065 [Candidatus Thorarchaeota archaeon]